jgi:NADH:ubiquinone oxidoreductase subunit 3 (subunit A)
MTTDYLNLADLKTLIIGLITGVVAFFVCVALQRYLSNRSIRSMKRRIEQSEAYKAELTNLAKSDRALLITSFQSVFLIIMLLCVIFMVETTLLLSRPGVVNSEGLALLAIWLLPIIGCFAIVRMLQQVANYPKSIEKIEAKITELKNKLLGNP